MVVAGARPYGESSDRETTHMETTRIDTLVVGGGQAGLVVGYHLQRRGIPFLIVDAAERTGDAWRQRWDSLRLFTPTKLSHLPGLPLPYDDWYFPTKDELADYLEAYAAHFDLPIRHGTRIEHLARNGDRFVAEAADERFEADRVVVAMASWQRPKTPPFADDLASSITQVHVADYRNPGQLADGPALVVGAGNSGAEVAMELSKTRDVTLVGPSTGALPFRPSSRVGHVLMPFFGKVILNGLLSTATPIGRKVRPQKLRSGEPLIRVKARDLEAAGVDRHEGKVAGVVDGSPQLDDGRVVDVASVVWCCGWDPGQDWIDLDVFDDDGLVDHDRGVVEREPGLYFVGLKFLHSALSGSLLPTDRDAGHVVEALAARRGATVAV